MQVAELATEQGPDARSRTSLLQQLESHGPAAAGSWRLALLCSGNLPDATLAMIRYFLGHTSPNSGREQRPSVQRLLPVIADCKLHVSHVNFLWLWIGATLHTR